jgi:NAD(P)-dependent dehydrogenase (short-subunit alcohol dehydrogenase family)
MAGRLLEKVTIITGAASGQGRAAAQMFAAEGARLVLSDLDRAGLDETAALVRARGQEALLHGGDLAEEATAQALVDLAVGRYGRLDVMYNNAGRVRFSPVHETSLEDWLFCLRNELTTVFLGCKYALRAMLPARAGAIVNVASASGLYGVPGHGSHAATKAGIIGLTRQIAVEYGPHGIRCNAIAPAYVDYSTPGARNLVGERGARTTALPPGVTVEDYPLGRFARPDDPVYGALYLASDEASFITGQVIVVDGGKTVG